MTSYELRISDLSSDVCSSDLRPAVTRERQPCHRTAFEQQHQRVTQRIRIAGPGISGPRTQATADFCLVFAEDRTRAVEGQSVSVRVDLGGRRIIQNKQ